MAGIVEDVGARVIIDAGEEAFEGDAVVKVFAGMNLISEVDALCIEGVEDRPPAFREFGEGFFDQSRGALRPRVEIGPGERARKSRVGIKTEPPARFGGKMKLLDRPFLPLGWLALQRIGREGIELRVVSGVHRDQLALQMRRQLGDLDPRLAAGTGKLVAIILTLGGLDEIDAAAVPGRNLDADIARIRHPARRRGQCVERRRVAHELREEYSRTLHAPAFPVTWFRL